MITWGDYREGDYTLQRVGDYKVGYYREGGYTLGDYRLSDNPVGDFTEEKTGKEKMAW